MKTFWWLGPKNKWKLGRPRSLSVFSSSPKQSLYFTTLTMYFLHSGHCTNYCVVFCQKWYHVLSCNITYCLGCVLDVGLQPLDYKIKHYKAAITIIPLCHLLHKASALTLPYNVDSRLLYFFFILSNEWVVLLPHCVPHIYFSSRLLFLDQILLVKNFILIIVSNE